MTHELAGALQQASRIRQCCAVKEPHVYVRGEYIHIAEGRISQTHNRTAVMQKLPDFVPALSHHLKPLMRDGSQFACMLFHPRIDGGISLDSAVESQQFRSHRRSTFFEVYGYLGQVRLFRAISADEATQKSGPCRRRKAGQSARMTVCPKSFYSQCKSALAGDGSWTRSPYRVRDCRPARFLFRRSACWTSLAR